MFLHRGRISLFLEGIMLIQQQYAKLILKRFEMTNCHSIAIPMEEGA
jgi:hypothetical protein